MFGILISAAGFVLQFLLRSVLVKFLVFFALYFVVVGFVEVLKASGLLPDASVVSSSFAGIPAGVWYFLDLFLIGTGIKTVMAASMAAFIIRRIPLIG